MCFLVAPYYKQAYRGPIFNPGIHTRNHCPERLNRICIMSRVLQLSNGQSIGNPLMFALTLDFRIFNSLNMIILTWLANFPSNNKAAFSEQYNGCDNCQAIHATVVIKLISNEIRNLRARLLTKCFHSSCNLSW